MRQFAIFIHVFLTIFLIFGCIALGATKFAKIMDAKSDFKDGLLMLIYLSLTFSLLILSLNLAFTIYK